MDPRYLLDDELQYELNLRNINIADQRGIAQLCECLNAEEDGKAENPLDSVRLTRQTVVRELKICDTKFADITKSLDEAFQIADDELAERAQSRLVHISGRVQRLLKFAPSHEAVKRLAARIVELDGQAKVARDSLGAGEQGATAQPLAHDHLEIWDALQQPPYTGTIPKSSQRYSKPASTAANPNTSSRKRIERASSELNVALNPGAKDFTRKAASLASNPEWNPSRIPHKPRNKGDTLRTHPTRSTPADDTVELLSNQFAELAPTVRDIFEDPGIIRAATANEVRRTGSMQSPANISRSSNGYSTHNVQRPIYNQLRYSQPDNLGLAGGHRIHQWTLRFDGSSLNLDAEDFIFRVERQASLYGVTTRALTIGVGDLLTGRASQWFWTHQRQHRDITWEQWKSAFFSRFTPHTETDFEIRARIEKRHQDQNEKFCDFCQDVEEMAIRLRRQMPEDELVEVLRRNMSIHLRKALWRDHIESMEELLRSCNEYERLCIEEKQQLSARRQMRVSELAYEQSQQYEYPSVDQEAQPHIIDAFKPNIPLVCWNCRDIGYLFMQCNQQQRGVFCFSCGMSGVMKVNCPKCSGNARRDNIPAGAIRPVLPAQPQSLHRALSTQQNQRTPNLFNRPPPS